MNDFIDSDMVIEKIEMEELTITDDLSVDRLTIFPGSQKWPVYHLECDEMLYVIEGRLNIWLKLGLKLKCQGW